MTFVQTKHGMAVGPHPFSAEAGVEILRTGGNAVDAAVAAAFTEAVVQPAHNGVAGYGGCLVAWLAKENKAIAVDYNTRTPAAAHADMFPFTPTATGSFSVPKRIHAVGPLAIGVPAVVAGLCFTLDKFGTLGRKQIIAPAVRAARDGFPVNGMTAKLIVDHAAQFRTDFPETARLLMPTGVPPSPQSILKNPETADLLEQIADEGPDVFYRGKIAKHIVDYIRKQGGILSEDDLANYEPRQVEPVSANYRGLTCFTPPLGAGGLTCLQLLKLLERFPITDYGAISAELFHHFLEAIKVCWQERLTKYGDPNFIDIDQHVELDNELITRLLDKVHAGLEKPQTGQIIAPDPMHCTSHLCTADSRGNMVSLTQTHGAGFGSLLSVPGTGLIFGHGVSRLDPRPGWANSIAPGKAPLHNMCPFLALRNGKPFAIYGTPGGRTIVNNIPYFTLNMVDFGMTMLEAITAPRLHCETAEPANLENAAPDSVTENLRAKGHMIESIERNGGPAHGIVVGTTRGQFDGATDPRGEGKVTWA